MDTVLTTDPAATLDPASRRRQTANRIFRGALIFNTALTAFWVFALLTDRTGGFFQHYDIGWNVIGRILGAIFFFYVVWGFIWYGVKTLLLKYFVGFSKEERRQAFSSRMREPFDVASFTARYSERRIRIADMIGRRGRFITLAAAGFYYLYVRVAGNPSPEFATFFLQDNLADAVITSWVFLAFYYANGFLAAAFYGPQSRVMDGVLARANCLLITTLWTAFKFVMVPIGGRLAAVFPPDSLRDGLRADLGRLHRHRRDVRDRRRAVREAETSGARHRRRQPEVDRRHGGRLRGSARLLPVDRRGPGSAGGVVRSRDHDRDGQHVARALLPQGHRRLFHGHGQRVDLPRLRHVSAVLISSTQVPDHWRSLALVRPSRRCYHPTLPHAWDCTRHPFMQNIGRYELVEKLGQGGMGAVYRARDTLLERTVAVKVISATIDQNEELRERFFREARAAGQLSHKNIITIHDLGEHEGQPYLAMEYLQGQDLLARMAAPQRMSLRRRVEIATEICEGLEFAHAHGVVHRDIKPANIFITDSGAVKILDFGLARLVTSELTRSNMMMGTVNYMAPEQVRGERIDHRADIFSTAVVIYELLSGRRAFDSDSFAATLYKILQEVPEPLQHIDPMIPIELVRIVDRALAKGRDERYQQMSEMLLDLAVFRQQLAGMDSPAGGRAAPTELRTPSDRPYQVTPPMPLPPVATAPPTVAATPSGVPITGPPASTPPAPTGVRGWLLPATAILALAIAGAAMWKSSRSDSNVPAPATPTAATAPIPTITEMMQTALGAFEKEDFATAERTADAVLSRDPGNDAARKLRDRARAAATSVDEGLKRARAHLSAGRFEDASKAASDVLDVAPHNSEALGIRENGAARSPGHGAEEARTQVARARNAARTAGAQRLASGIVFLSRQRRTRRRATLRRRTTRRCHRQVPRGQRTVPRRRDRRAERNDEARRRGASEEPFTRTGRGRSRAKHRSPSPAGGLVAGHAAVDTTGSRERGTACRTDPGSPHHADHDGASDDNRRAGSRGSAAAAKR